MEPVQINQKLEIDKQLLDLRELYKFESKEVENENDAQTVGAYLKLISDRKKKIVAARTSVTGPIKEGIKNFEAMIRGALQPLESVDKNLRSKLGAYWDKQQAIVDEQARIEREKQVKELEAKAKEEKQLAIETGSITALEKSKELSKNSERIANKPIVAKQTIRTSEGTIGQMTYYDWEIENKALIPVSYYTLNEKKINAIAKSYGKEPIEIAGIKFIKKSKPIVG